MVFRVLSSLVSSRLRVAGILVLLALAVLSSVVRVHLYGHFEGIYVLKTRPGWVEITDDLIFGDEGRLLFALPAEPIIRFLRGDVSHAKDAPYREYEWFRSDGSGFVRAYFPDGTEFLTCMSRFLDSGGNVTKGLFVGGALPFDLKDSRRISQNESGMAFFDGNRWNHLWCNVNESISSWKHPEAALPPSSWRFLGSGVVKETGDELVIASSHEVVLDGEPVRIDRHAFFKSGTRYVALAIRITNTGKSPTGFFYVYGDEPWVGEYGSSAGNVGWVRDRLVPYEGTIDTRAYRWAGYFHYGNEAAGESHAYSGFANFIEWQGSLCPDLAYFSNRIGFFAREKDRVPLADANNRVLFLQWGPRLLNPGQSETIILSIGMADRDPRTGFPVKPDTTFDAAGYASLLATGI
ncbi:MAG: hypothetical protein ED859_05190 [Desulfuromonadales bacterium]|nr:MAG: hypothetical protein ED859_05190 [Desulfuromonadales bacterium]